MAKKDGKAAAHPEASQASPAGSARGTPRSPIVIDVAANATHVQDAPAQSATEPATPDLPPEPLAETVSQTSPDGEARTAEMTPEGEVPPTAEPATDVPPTDVPPIPVPASQKAVPTSTKAPNTVAFAALGCAALALVGTGALALRGLKPAATAPDTLAALQALDARASKAETALASLDDLQARVAKLEAVLQAPVAETAADAAAPSSPISPNAAAAPATPAPRSLAADLAPLTSRVVDLEQKLGTQTQRIDNLAAVPQIDVAATNAKTANALASADAAALLVVTQSLLQAVDAGRPFAEQVAALTATLPNDPAVASLIPVAATGVATQKVLADSFAPLAGPVLAGLDPKAEGTLWDRLVRGAAKLVRVRPVGTVAGDDPPAIIARLEGDLNLGDVAGALSERAKLPADAQSLTASWAAKAQARVEALSAANALVRSATQRLAKAKP